MRPRYEEKTFESYFNAELDRRASIYFPFGQVQEGGIGADAAALSGNRRLWRRLGYRYWLRMPFVGADLREIADVMEARIGQEIRNIPRLQANLLFQYKRPERITSRLGSEWFHWNQTYYRYEIYSEQQDLLEHLDARFGRQALILYASPALEDVNALVQAKRAGKLIESTNFRRAIELAGHHRNTYVRAGTHSVACSEPVWLEKFDLLAHLQNLQPAQDVENSQMVVQFANGVREVASASAFIGNAFQAEIAPYVEIGIDKHKLLFSMITMIVFRELTGAQWAISMKEAS